MKDKFKAVLPDCEFVDFSEGAMHLRMLKSAQEIEHIIKMTKINELGGAACAEAIAMPVVIESTIFWH